MSTEVTYAQLLSYLEFTHHIKGTRKLPEYIKNVIHRDISDFIEYDKNRQGILLRKYRNYHDGKLVHRVHELCKDDVSAAMFYIPPNKAIMVSTANKRFFKMIKNDVANWEDTEIMVLFNLYNALHSFNPKVISMDEYMKQRDATKAL